MTLGLEADRGSGLPAPRLVEVAVDAAGAAGARTYTYLVPDSLADLEPGEAVLAAGGVIALLDAIAELGRVAGLDEAGSLAIYGPLIEGTLGNARALGIQACETAGPQLRSEVAAHLLDGDGR